MNTWYLGLSLLGAMWLLALILFIHGRLERRRVRTVDRLDAAPRRGRGRPILAIAGVVLVLVILVAVFVPVYARQSPVSHLTTLKSRLDDLSKDIADKKEKLQSLDQKSMVSLSAKISVEGLPAPQAKAAESINDLKGELMMARKLHIPNSPQAAAEKQNIKDLKAALSANPELQSDLSAPARVDAQDIKELQAASLLRQEVQTATADLARTTGEIKDTKAEIKNVDAVKKQRSTWLIWLGLVLIMLVGIGCKTTWDWMEVRKTQPTAPLDLPSCIQPLLVSPFIFVAVMAGVTGKDGAVQLNLMSFIFAFQNGFMWRTVFARKTA